MNNIGLNINRIPHFKGSSEVDNQQLQAQIVSEPQELQPVELPDIYQHNIETTKKSKIETLKKFDIMNIVVPWFEHPLMMLGTCAGLSIGVDKFSDACCGEYEKSLVGKAAKFGDKIENSKFVKSKPVQSVLGFFKKSGNYIKEKAKNSDLINAIVKTPSQPEWDFVKAELLNMQQHVAQDFTQVIQKLKLNQDGYAKLSDLYIKKEERDFLKNLFGVNNISEEMASNAVQLKRIGVAEDEILRIINGADATKTVKLKQLEKLGLTGELCDGRKGITKGFYMRGGREMDNHFECMWDMFRSVPSIETPNVSVLDEYYWLNKHDPNYSLFRATKDCGKDAHTDKMFKLDKESAMELCILFITKEKDLEDKKIEEVLQKSFWNTNFWLYWQTIFAFQK